MESAIMNQVVSGPEFCHDKCDVKCETEKVVVPVAGPTFCHDQCDVKCETDDDLIKEANTIANAVFVSTADLSMVEERLRKEGIVPAELVDEAVAEYRKFMGLVAAGHRGLSMISPIVDEVWHAHILHTQDYAAFCDATVGRFVHHQPNTERTPIAPSEGPRFIDIYRATYGELPAVWQRGGGISGCAVM